jgi:hypothetical protein
VLASLAVLPVGLASLVALPVELVYALGEQKEAAKSFSQ